MSTCTGPGCVAPARVAIKTIRPVRSDIKSTVFYTPELAPRGAQLYCGACAAHLLTELIFLLGEQDTTPPTKETP